MAKDKTKSDTALAKLISAAPTKALSELILNLAEDDPGIRRECFDYLKGNTAVSKMLERQSEGEAISLYGLSCCRILRIWMRMVADLMGWKTRCGNCCMKLQNV